MTMSNKVMMSILAMDSYNRGDGAGIIVAGTKLGTATWVDKPLPDNSPEFGFYATTYEWNNARVISYRGTNFDFNSSEGGLLNSPGVKVMWRGWSVGAGCIENTQADLAIRYYEAVTGRSVWDATDTGGPITILTGHSLGGGLAGLVGSLSYRQTYAFDYMPFGAAAWAEVILSPHIRPADLRKSLEGAADLEVPCPDLSDMITRSPHGTLALLCSLTGAGPAVAVTRS